MHFPVKKIYGNIGYNMCEVMHVVVISQVRRVRALAYVYADGSLLLRIAWKHFQKNPLREGDVIDPEAYTDQLAAAQFKDAYEAALTCLDRSERTGSDLTRALVYKGYVPPAAEAAVARLTEAGLVDDLRYASRLAESAAGKPVGIACAMKNAGVGVGIPDWGRCRLIVEDDGKLHIYTGASCIGQGLGTVLVQMIVTNTDLCRDDIVYERSNTWIAPDSGDTSGSRQTMITGEACRRACEKLMQAKQGKALAELKGQEFYGEYLAKTDPLGADVPNPVSHVAYGYATQLCILDKTTGLVEKIVAAHDVGKAVNPLSCEGQIEGGVVMSMGYALTEEYRLDAHCKPISRFGTLGLFRAHQAPEIKAIVIDKPGLNVACGAIGIGEITSIPTAPAIAEAYYQLDGERRFSLPLSGTPYERK